MKVEIPHFDNVHVMVVGDVMLDRNWRGDTKRISPEAPVPVVSVQRMDERPGGAGNVAVNISALGAKASLLSLVGQDDAADALQAKLQEAKVDCLLHRIAGYPTITKLRIIDKNHQLIRLDFEQRYQIEAATQLAKDMRSRLQGVQAIILSDYGKGSLGAIQDMIQTARNAKVPVLVDPKSQDFSIYRGATVVTPNLKEFEAVVGVCHSEEEIATKALQLLRTHHFDAVLVTRGEHGMSLIRENLPPLHLPSRAREVYDVTGAGDTVIAVLAAAYAAGEDLAAAAMLANTAAGISVQKMGAATVSVPELRRALQRHHTSELGILTEEELLMAIADARAHGETIVMTNGCFDILHVGHVTYLEQAKALGSRLIVAVNDDASVARLKGTGRPINGLTQRLHMLSALRAVDWLVSFSEDTPARLIQQVLPDVLVKGGDYTDPNSIAGANAVLANGGKVELLPFVDGYSTTSLIQKIRGEELCSL